MFLDRDYTEFVWYFAYSIKNDSIFFAKSNLPIYIVYFFNKFRIKYEILKCELIIKLS